MRNRRQAAANANVPYSFILHKICVDSKTAPSEYSFSAKMSKAEIVGELFKIYEKLTSESKQNNPESDKRVEL